MALQLPALSATATCWAAGPEGPTQVGCSTLQSLPPLRDPEINDQKKESVWQIKALCSKLGSNYISHKTLRIQRF